MRIFFCANINIASHIYFWAYRRYQELHVRLKTVVRQPVSHKRWSTVVSVTGTRLPLSIRGAIRINGATMFIALRAWFSAHRTQGLQLKRRVVVHARMLQLLVSLVLWHVPRRHAARSAATRPCLPRQAGQDSVDVRHISPAGSWLVSLRDHRNSFVHTDWSAYAENAAVERGKLSRCAASCVRWDQCAALARPVFHALCLPLFAT